MAVEIVMPQITMTMVEGVIAEWHKKEGERIAEGEPLVDIETDKVVQTLNAAASGTLLKILAKEGDAVPVGKAFYIVGEAGGTEACAAVTAEAAAPSHAETEKTFSEKSNTGSKNAVEVVMPQITMTMVEGVIAGWHKKKGDAIKEGEPLVDIETDKVVQTLNASASGILLEVRAQEGDVVPVGKVFCVIGSPDSPVLPSTGESRKGFSSVNTSGGGASTAQFVPVSQPGERIIAMPRLSARMKDAVVVRWLRSEGEEAEKDDPLFDAEVDDIRQVVKAPESGTILRIIAHSGQTVRPGDPIYAVESEAAASCSAVQGYIPATPMAKRLAGKIGLNLAQVAPGGPDGLIVESDVKRTMVTPQTNPAQSAVKPATAAVSEEDVELIPFRGIRRRIAENLMVTKQTMADVTTFAEINMSRVKAFRENLHLSYNVFILKAAALALQDYPIMNSSIVGDNIAVKKSVGLCVAVATKRGLVTPVMHHAEKMNLISIAEQLEDYAERGRDGKLTAEDFAGGTFTVTNSGTYGALFFTPIINSPQSAILGVGKIMMTPVVNQDGQITAAPMMIGCLSYDHRVVDGETAVKFLQKIKFYLENPDQMTVIRRK
ncbi:MAG: 2-oxo acid dehydrogenase subunit E2 [Pyramidobacter sp.]